jgi:ABC-2 type transport system ATP-binding protein
MAGLAAREWVKEIQRYGDQLLIGAQQAEEKIPLAVHIAQELSITITTVSLRKPTLEDVFLHYTGKTMRDEDAQEGDAPRGRMRRRGGHH